MNPTPPNRPPAKDEIQSLVRDALERGGMDARDAHWLAAHLRDPHIRGPLLEGAFQSKRDAKGDVVTVSRNIFIPLTNLCRNRCSYCTFAKLPDSAEVKNYRRDEVAELVRGGVATGCTEALLCLGDKPEIAYRSHRKWLEESGYTSTVDHIEDACRVTLEGGMLPHTNAGILTQDDMVRLRPLNASMGLMLETTSERLCGRGMPHHHAPDKKPAVRLRMHEEAGELQIPFTTGVLLGIGETEVERLDTIFAIRDLSDRYGHIQEVILQPFHPKPGTRMRAASSLPDEEVASWIALARLVLGPEMNIQAPPNLAPDVLEVLLRSGLNDWGGVSPVTVDFINPEAPWPTLRELRKRTEQAGQTLRDRLPVYPDWVTGRADFFDPELRVQLLRHATDEGYARPRNHQSDEEAA